MIFGQADGESKERQSALARLIFSVVGIWAAYRLFTWLAGLYLLRGSQSSANNFLERLLGFAYPATPVFLLVEMLIVIWIYRPLSGLFDISQDRAANTRPTKEVLLGTAAGLIVFVLATPFLKDLGTRTTFLAFFPASHPAGARSLTYAVLLGLALPTVGEIFFRGIVLRTLKTYAGPTAAILVSTLLFVSLWPLFSVMTTLFLSVAASLLYTWRKNLISPIFASIVMTICSGCYVLWRIWS